MRQKFSTSTPMRLLAISLVSAETVHSAATHNDIISPKYIITRTIYWATKVRISEGNTKKNENNSFSILLFAHLFVTLTFGFSYSHSEKLK